MDLSQQLIAIGSVFSLLILAGTVAKRQGVLNRFIRKRAAADLELVQRIVLTAHHSVHLVRANGRVLVIATHPRGLECLDAQIGHSSAGAAGSRGAKA